MKKEPHPNYDPDAIRQSFGVFGKLFENGSPAGKLTIAFVGGVAVMGGFLWVANYFSNKQSGSYRSIAEQAHFNRQRELRRYRGANEVCTTNSAACKQWTIKALHCEKRGTGCSEMEAYREKVSRVALSSDAGAYSF